MIHVTTFVLAGDDLARNCENCQSLQQLRVRSAQSPPQSSLGAESLARCVGPCVQGPSGCVLPRYHREFLRRSHLAYAESMHSLAACIAARNGGAHAARLGLFWEANPFTEPADTLLRIEWHLGWWDYWLSWRKLTSG